MSDDSNPQTSVGAEPSEPQKSRPTTPLENRAVTAARHQSNTSTPRTIRSNGKYAKLTALRNEIARHMDGEFVECPVSEFFSHYLPFEPEDAVVQDFITKATYTPLTPAEPVDPPEVAAPTRPSRTVTEANTTHLLQRRADQIVEWEGNDLRFLDYLELPVTSGEAVTYGDLKTIMQAIGGATITGRPRNKFRYHPCPDTPIQSETPGSNNKIDACIISDACFNGNKVALKATGIAVAFEFKLKPDKIIENNLQVVSANVQLMNDDVRRMFTYGVTIIGEMVTLWYHGRSHSAISEPFSFIQDPQLFIKAMMSFLFATEAELGYDPTITRMPDNRLVFTMTDKDGKPIYYRTIRQLSDYRTCNITGRMTRVWEVEQVSNANGTGEGSSRAVLKDIWLDDGAPTERQVQEAIFQSIEDRYLTIKASKVAEGLGKSIRQELRDVLKRQRYKKFFLTILADWQGQLSKTLPPGARRKHGLLFADAIQETEAVESLHSDVNVDRVASNVPQETRLEQEQAARKIVQPRAFGPKRQYRVVFEELCVTVGQLPILGEVMDVLNQTLGALRLLYFAGWVHRDLSTGNVMAYRRTDQDGWQAKLCDLEYAKRYSTTDNVPSGDPKTGTPYFMALEILKNSPLLPDDTDEIATTTTVELGQAEARKSEAGDREGEGESDNAGQHPRIEDDETDDESHDESGDDDEAGSTDDEEARLEWADVVSVIESAPTEGQQSRTIIHNFQHDLESIWWISLYSVTARVDHGPSQQYSKTIFQHRTDVWDERTTCFRRSIVNDLNACLRHDVKVVVKVLNKLRGQLLKSYYDINLARLKNGSVDDSESFAAIHKQFYFGFEALLKSNNKDFAAVALVQEKSGNKRFLPAPQRKKRPRSIHRDDDDFLPTTGNEEEEESEEEKATRKAKNAKRTKTAGK